MKFYGIMVVTLQWIRYDEIKRGIIYEQAVVLEYPFKWNNAFGRTFVWASDMETRNIHFFS